MKPQINFAHMEKLFIEGKKNTPNIVLDPETKTFNITGESRPENATAFYEKVLTWLDMYLKELNAANKKDPFVVTFKLEYFNSSSAKFIMTIAQKLYEFISKGIPVSIDWYYDADDDGMMETGSDLSVLSKVPVNLICNE